MSKIKTYLLTLLCVVLAYGGSVKYGFSQDDWYFLLISDAHNLSEVANFFNPLSQSGFAFFRPLGTQLYYFLFGGNPLYMHIFMLLIQSLSGYFVYDLLRGLKLKSPTPILAGILYSVSSVHFLSLYYIAATQQLLSASFSLLSLILFLDRKYLPSTMVFALALLSKETAIVVPAVALILTLITKSKTIIRPLIPYGVLSVAYLLLRFATSSVTQSQSQLSFGPSVLTNIRWYFLFAANFPETLVNYGLPRMGINIAKFIADLGTPALIITLCSSLITLLALTRLVQTKRWLYGLWFVVGLGPVILLRNHLYPHYLDLALIPFLLLLLQDLKPKYQYVVAVFFIFTSLYSIQFSAKHHWTTGRAHITQIALTTYDWNTACGQDNIAFVGEGDSPRELSYALSLANGPRVICNEPDLGVYYLTAEALAKGVEEHTIPEGIFVVEIGNLSK